ncbi:hypothetical protein C0995_005132 [Termitomyces sp. Mi166|nr:hypothetical protein C0995_005132 [Termitomyces sp. Mi166\
MDSTSKSSAYSYLYPSASGGYGHVSSWDTLPTPPSAYSYPYPSASGGYGHVSSWDASPTPPPTTPLLGTVPLPICCSSGHPSPGPHTPGAAAHSSGHPSPGLYTPDTVVHPMLQKPYNAIIPPHPAPYAFEPAIHPPVATLTLRLTPHPYMRIPSMDVTLSSPHGPLTVYDIHIFIHHTLSHPITHADLRGLDQVAHDAVSSAFYARTANDPNASAKGICVGDRMGGAWCIVGVVPTREPGIWVVRLDVPRRR